MATFLRLCAVLRTAACEDHESVLCWTQHDLLLGIQWLPATVWSCVEGLTAAATCQIEFECWPQACFASSGPCSAHWWRALSPEPPATQRHARGPPLLCSSVSVCAYSQDEGFAGQCSLPGWAISVVGIPTTHLCWSSTQSWQLQLCLSVDGSRICLNMLAVSLGLQPAVLVL